jgi:hypothetical protein
LVSKQCATNSKQQKSSSQRIIYPNPSHLLTVAKTTTAIATIEAATVAIADTAAADQEDIVVGAVEEPVADTEDVVAEAVDIDIKVDLPCWE